MRTLVITVTLSLLSIGLWAQNDFISLDRANYDYYLKKDYKNLKKSANKILALGTDYYYLRLRLGILSYEKERYAASVDNFLRARQMNPFDTISNEYIFYSYLFSGRTNDAYLFLKRVNEHQKDRQLKSIKQREGTIVYGGYSFNSYDVYKYSTNSLNYEAIESVSALNAGTQFGMGEHMRGTVGFTNLNKKSTVYSSTDSTGKYGTLTQNQLYFRLNRFFERGWELYGFAHCLFYNTDNSTRTYGRRSSSSTTLNTEVLYGLGFTKKSWYVRGGASFYHSNYSSSTQLAAEGSLSVLPFGNLNLYTTVSGMFQHDKNWGNTYQSNVEIGSKVFKYLWVEAGLLKGNSFLYSRYQGSFVNNSFLIPQSSYYGSFIIPIKKITLTVTGNYTNNVLYSWDTTDYTRTLKVEKSSVGINTLLTIKF